MNPQRLTLSIRSLRLLSSPKQQQQQCSCFSSFSRMLDLGGAPSPSLSAQQTRIQNTNKNCKVQAVCFDFQVLIQSVQQLQESQQVTPKTNAATTEHAILGKVQPDTEKINHISQLLKVPSHSQKHHQRAEQDEDDLSLLLTDDDNEDKTPRQANTQDNTKKQPSSSSPFTDIRSKYAGKLVSKGIQGGIADVERVKHQIEETLHSGDAAGHLAARQIVASSNSHPASTTRWMAMTGTGRMLQYLTQRNTRIILLATPVANNQNQPDKDWRSAKSKQQAEAMLEFKKQLKDVVFDFLITDGTLTAAESIKAMLLQTTKPTKTTSDADESSSCEPSRMVLVSDRDDFIRAGKEADLLTCRVRPSNQSPRGNVSAHYNIQQVAQVQQQVIDQINGISFNAILQGK